MTIDEMRAKLEVMSRKYGGDTKVLGQSADGAYHFISKEWSMVSIYMTSVGHYDNDCGVVRFVTEPMECGCYGSRCDMACKRMLLLDD